METTASNYTGGHFVCTPEDQFRADGVEGTNVRNDAEWSYYEFADGSMIKVDEDGVCFAYTPINNEAFHAWAATKKPVTGKTNKDFASLYGEYASGFEYAEGWIQLNENGSYYAVFGNQERLSEYLEDVELFLFNNMQE